jgi:predicted nicotinamide N-methyase
MKSLPRRKELAFIYLLDSYFCTSAPFPFLQGDFISSAWERIVHLMSGIGQDMRREQYRERQSIRRLLQERFPLQDRTLTVAGRDWQISLVMDQEALVDRLETEIDLQYFPYGMVLWASSVALAEHLAQNPALIHGKSVLEIGAGVGLPGLVARFLGAETAQTDFLPSALQLAQLNALQNGVEGIQLFWDDWRQFRHTGKYDLLIGADVLYERSVHAALKEVFLKTLKSGGAVLLADPQRPAAFEFMDSLLANGWTVDLQSRRVRWEAEDREIALIYVQRDE